MEKLTINVTKVGKLTKILPRELGVPYAAVMRALRNKDVKVNGVRVNNEKTLALGDCVEIYLAPFDKSGYKRLYLDENVLVVDKCQGVLSESLFEMVCGEFSSARYIHRLDRNTSGVIIFALTAAAEKELLAGFKNHAFTKRYVARVKGLPNPKEGVLCGYLVKDACASHVRITDKKTAGALPIKTGYKVISSDGESSIVDIRLYTGRTHQIRAQFAHIGCPVAGDEKYGDREFNKRIGLKRQQLCAKSLTLTFDKNSPLYYLNGKTFTSEG